MKNIIRIFAFFLLLSLTYVSAADNNKTVLKIGTKIAPPFAMKDSSGKWEGISIELWKNIAKDLNISYQFYERDLEGLLEDTAKKRLDVAVAALTITSEREKVMDFSHSYYTTWLTIAVEKKEQNFLYFILKSVFSKEMLFILLMLLSTIVVIGILIWLSERERYPETFGKGVVSGISNAIWWIATMMVPINKDANAPKRAFSKFLEIIWLFIFIILIATILATISNAISSYQTMKNLQLKDIVNKKVATVSCSTSERYLIKNGIKPLKFKSIEETLKALKQHKVDVIVYDYVLLNYYVNKYYKNSIILSNAKFSPQNYSIAVPQGSKLLEPINQKLLEIKESPKWDEIKAKYIKKPN